MTPREPLTVLQARIIWGILFPILALICWLCSGCATPGRAGFRELAAGNARERTALRAATVSSERITDHLTRAGASADRLATVATLTQQQQGWLSDLRLELSSARSEVGVLRGSLEQARGEIEKRDAVIRDTRAAVDAAVRAGFWSKVRFAAVAAFGCFVVGVIFASLLRGLVGAAALALRTYFRV